jgi:hypothetical protein
MQNQQTTSYPVQGILILLILGYVLYSLAIALAPAPAKSRVKAMPTSPRGAQVNTEAIQRELVGGTPFPSRI